MNLVSSMSVHSRNKFNFCNKTNMCIQYVLSYTTNHQHVSITYEIVIGSFTRVLRTQQTAKLCEWND